MCEVEDRKEEEVAKVSTSKAAQHLHAEAVKLQRERARREAELQRCDACAFATYAGSGVWFCPLPVCRFDKGVHVDA